jgi:nucleoside-diphosphate-sugar epimerase
VDGGPTAGAIADVARDALGLGQVDELWYESVTLYRLAVENAPIGAVLNAVGDEGVPTREIAEAIGRHLNLPAKSLPAEDFEAMYARMLSTDMPASSAITQELMGWKPTHPGLIEDIQQGHYFT